MTWLCYAWIDADGQFRYVERLQPWRTAFAEKARLALTCPDLVCWVEPGPAVSACVISVRG